MFVFLKLLLFLFRPLLWIILLFLYSLLTKQIQRKKWSFRLALTMLLFFTNPFPVRWLMSLYEAKPVQLAPTQKFNVGILLGGLVSYSPGDKRGYFNNASDRFIQTAFLYKQGHLNHIIVAAGNGYLTKTRFSEAAFIKEQLVYLGIPADKIYTDGESRNTVENARNTKRITDSARLSGPYLLISSAMHLPRAAKLFRKAGIDAVLYPCDFHSRGGGNNFLDDYFLPSADALSNWENLIKEWAGTVAYAVMGSS